MNFDTTKQEFNILFPKIVHIDPCMYSKELKICKHKCTFESRFDQKKEELIMDDEKIISYICESDVNVQVFLEWHEHFSKFALALIRQDPETEPKKDNSNFSFENAASVDKINWTNSCDTPKFKNTSFEYYASRSSNLSSISGFGPAEIGYPERKLTQRCETEVEDSEIFNPNK